MIGGTVIATKPLPDRIWVNCKEDSSTSKCAIFVKRTERSEKIKPGDVVWWQGDWAMWTPSEHRGITTPQAHDLKLKPGEDYEVRIPKFGYSGVKEPA